MHRAPGGAVQGSVVLDGVATIVAATVSDVATVARDVDSEPAVSFERSHGNTFLSIIQTMTEAL